MPTLTYVDSGVLIALTRGTEEVYERALAVLDDPDRQFASSAFVELEVTPKPTCHGRGAEVAMYEMFFENVSRWAEDVAAIVEQAREEARTHGLSAMDALHVAAAASVGADELLTIEHPAKHDSPCRVRARREFAGLSASETQGRT